MKKGAFRSLERGWILAGFSEGVRRYSSSGHSRFVVVSEF
jgi:hypothetical protein